ncbi:hypothetical protein CEXT_37791 [Caerostris extrusa]|uniref:Uncharacterized protein n=1 Tax=Caerostris extrusa TaxID=172846 RepID=A0AAV4V346_CAEEX|nr:hypothetical protein CEXT_37791 [Caerostris extrusa]
MLMKLICSRIYFASDADSSGETDRKKKAATGVCIAVREIHPKPLREQLGFFTVFAENLKKEKQSSKTKCSDLRRDGIRSENKQRRNYPEAIVAIASG